jgi:hypothetical protein
MIRTILYVLSAIILLSLGCKSVAKFPIDEPSMANLEDGLIGRWKFEEDTDKRNFYEIQRGDPYRSDRYHIKFWNRGGTNPTYEWNIHVSKIDGIQFINVPYYREGPRTHEGYLFLRILDANKDFTKMTTTTVYDTTMWELDQAEVKERIRKNLNNPSFYYDTVHFYKIPNNTHAPTTTKSPSKADHGRTNTKTNTKLPSTVDFERAMTKFVKFYNHKQNDSIVSMWPANEKADLDRMWTDEMIERSHKTYGTIISFKYLGIDTKDANPGLAVFKTEFSKAGKKTTSLTLDNENHLGTFRFITSSEGIDELLKKEK